MTTSVKSPMAGSRPVATDTARVQVTTGVRRYISRSAWAAKRSLGSVSPKTKRIGVIRTVLRMITASSP